MTPDPEHKSLGVSIGRRQSDNQAIRQSSALIVERQISKHRAPDAFFYFHRVDFAGKTGGVNDPFHDCNNIPRQCQLIVPAPQSSLPV